MDQRAESSAAFARGRRRGQRSRPSIRLWPALVALLIALVGYLLNVQGRSLLDLLPLGWSWLTLWLAISVGLELCERWRAASTAGRRDQH